MEDESITFLRLASNLNAKSWKKEVCFGTRELVAIIIKDDLWPGCNKRSLFFMIMTLSSSIFKRHKQRVWVGKKGEARNNLLVFAAGLFDVLDGSGGGSVMLLKELVFRV